MGEPAPTEPDDLLRLTRELAEAHAAISRLETENAPLRRRLGQAAPSRRPLPIPRLSSSYRTEAPLLQLERALQEANVAVADLSIESAILRSRAESRRSPARSISWLHVLLAVAITSGGALVWFATESPGLLVWLGIVLALGGGLFRLIGAIQPDGSNTRRSPYLPGG